MKVTSFTLYLPRLKLIVSSCQGPEKICFLSHARCHCHVPFFHVGGSTQPALWGCSHARAQAVYLEVDGQDICDRITSLLFLTAPYTKESTPQVREKGRVCHNSGISCKIRGETNQKEATRNDESIKYCSSRKDYIIHQPVQYSKV